METVYSHLSPRKNITMTTLLMRGLALLAILTCVLPSAHAQAVWETNFTNTSASGSVSAIAETPEAVFYGGNFSSFGLVSANNIVRVDKTTGAVTPLGSNGQNGTNGSIVALAVIGTDLYVAGGFTTVTSSTQSNVVANRIAKWNTATGTWAALGDATQNGAGQTVTALAVMGTVLYVGGTFNTVSSITQNAISANGIAKWDSTTGTWSALGDTAQNGVGPSAAVSAVAVVGADVYVGGGFTTVSSSTQNGISANQMAKWDSVAGIWYPLGSASQNGTSGSVFALAKSGTDIYVGGSFTAVSSATQSGLGVNKIAKWDSAAGTWSPLGDAVQNGIAGGSGVVYALALSGTDLYAGGDFLTASSASQPAVSANRIVKWIPSAGSWTPFGSAEQNGAIGNSDRVIALLAVGNDVYVGGNRLSVVSSSAQPPLATPNAAKWNSTTESWTAPPALPNDGFPTGSQIETMVDAGDVVYVGGTFTSVAGVSVNNVACWNKVTRTWSALGTSGNSALNGTNGIVFSLTLNGTDLYVGGRFTTVSSSTQSSISANSIAKWNITTRTWSQLGDAVRNGVTYSSGSASVAAMVVSGTNLYVGGNFTAVNSASQYALSGNSIAKWDITTGTWALLGSNAQNGTGSLSNVMALAASGSKIYVGGSFTTVSSSTQNSLPASNIATWDSAAEAWSIPVVGPNNAGVRAFALIGTDLYVGGSFTSPANQIARLNTATGAWSALGGAQNGANNTIRSLVPVGSALYVGGSFTTVSSSTQSGISANRIARWNLVAETWEPLGSAVQNGTDNTVRAMAYGGSLYVGGSFTTVSSGTQNAIPSRYFGTYIEAAADIAVAQASPLTDGAGSVSFAVAQGGIGSNVLTFTISNPGYSDLTSLAVTKDGLDAADFTVSALSGTSIPAGAGTVTFTVTFTPASATAKIAALHIASNAPGSKNPFDIALTGTTLTYTTDADNDGLNDASEVNLAALGFNWQVAQPALVATYYANANGAGLYTPAQVQALNIGTPLIQRTALGQFKLTLGVEKSTTLQPGSFQPFPMTVPQTTINGAGKLEFLFTVPDNAAFFRLEAK